MAKAMKTKKKAPRRNWRDDEIPLCEYLLHMGACKDAINFAREYSSLEEAWQHVPENRIEWLVWLMEGWVGSPASDEPGRISLRDYKGLLSRVITEVEKIVGKKPELKLVRGALKSGAMPEAYDTNLYDALTVVSYANDDGFDPYGVETLAYELIEFFKADSCSNDLALRVLKWFGSKKFKIERVVGDSEGRCYGFYNSLEEDYSSEPVKTKKRK